MMSAQIVKHIFEIFLGEITEQKKIASERMRTMKEIL